MFHPSSAHISPRKNDVVVVLACFPRLLVERGTLRSVTPLPEAKEAAARTHRPKKKEKKTELPMASLQSDAVGVQSSYVDAAVARYTSTR